MSDREHDRIVGSSAWQGRGLRLAVDALEWETLWALRKPLSLTLRALNWTLRRFNRLIRRAFRLD